METQKEEHNTILITKLLRILSN